jgi:hypothetical protein
LTHRAILDKPHQNLEAEGNPMKTLFHIGLILLPNLFLNTAHAYGSQGGAKACEKPSFSKFQPAPNAAVQAFSDFSFTASPNTSSASIAVTVSSGTVKHAFKTNDLQITERKDGRLEIKGRLENPIRAGFVRLNIAAESKRGCDKAEGYLIKLGAGDKQP